MTEKYELIFLLFAIEETEIQHYHFFLIVIHSMQGWTATTSHRVPRKRITTRVQHIGNLFRKNLQLKDVC